MIAMTDSVPAGTPPRVMPSTTSLPTWTDPSGSVLTSSNWAHRFAGVGVEAGEAAATTGAAKIRRPSASQNPPIAGPGTLPNVYRIIASYPGALPSSTRILPRRFGRTACSHSGQRPPKWTWSGKFSLRLGRWVTISRQRATGSEPTAITYSRRITRKLFKQTIQQGRSKRSGESYTCRTVSH